MCLCGVCNKIALKWRVALLYMFPFVYFCMLVIVLGIIPAPFSTYPLLSTSCLIFAVLNLLTGVVGLLGVFKGIDAALRGTVVLLVMENLMLLFVALFFLFSAVCRSLPVGLSSSEDVKPTATLRWHIDRAIYWAERTPVRETERMEFPSPLWKQAFLPWKPETKWLFLLISSAFLVMSTSLTMCCLWAVAEFQAELDADAFVEDARNLRESERMMLLQTCKSNKRGATGSKMLHTSLPTDKDRSWFSFAA